MLLKKALILITLVATSACKQNKSAHTESAFYNNIIINVLDNDSALSVANLGNVKMKILLPESELDSEDKLKHPNSHILLNNFELLHKNKIF